MPVWSHFTDDIKINSYLTFNLKFKSLDIYTWEKCEIKWRFNALGPSQELGAMILIDINSY